MTDEKNITEAQLHAFIDHELCGNEQTEILNLISGNPELSKIANEMRHDMDMVAMAYRNLPVKRSITNLSGSENSLPMRYASVAAALLICFGTITGWFIASHTNQSISPAFTMVDDFNPAIMDAEKILIHVSTLDKNRVTSALNKLEEILKVSERNQSDVKLEFVANAEGLSILRQGSPYANRIKSLSSRYKNVEFLACGIAMETVRLKENNEVRLLPEAKKIPAALNEILEKLEAGWVYVRS
jgi:intracellular sulfur oxidation DsrE/DsrF family protein